MSKNVNVKKYEDMRKSLIGTERHCTVHQFRIMLPGNPNRGEDGLPKTLHFGGKRRSYISPQAQMRPIRESESMEYLASMNEVYINPIRTRSWVENYIKEQKGLVSEAELIKLVRASMAICLLTQGKKIPDIIKKTKDKKVLLSALNDIVSNGEEDRQNSDAVDNDDRAKLLHHQLYLFHEDLLNAFIEIIQKFKDEKNDSKLCKDILNEIKNVQEKTPVGVIEALIGNFSPGDALVKREGAWMVSPMVSTGALDVIDCDFFVGMDDFKNESAHLGEKYMASGLGYGAMSCDLYTLARNMGVDKIEEAKKAYAPIIPIVAGNTPIGSRSRSFDKNFPRMVMVSMSTSPMSYMEAFSLPTQFHEEFGKNNDITLTALRQLGDHIRSLHNLHKGAWHESLAYILDDQFDVELPGKRFENIHDLEKWVSNFDIYENKYTPESIANGE